MIIGLTGLNAAGKGAVSDILKEKGFSYYLLSDILRVEATKRNLEHSRENLVAIGNEFREKGGPNILAKMMLDKIKEDNSENKSKLKVIVDSIRNPGEIEELRKDPSFKLIGVTAPIEVRFQRSISRGRNENAETLEEFKAQEEKEKSSSATSQQLHKTYEMIDFEIINDCSLEELKEKTEEILNGIK